MNNSALNTEAKRRSIFRDEVTNQSRSVDLDVKWVEVEDGVANLLCAPACNLPTSQKFSKAFC